MKPSTFLPAMKCLGAAVICMVGYLQINGRTKINDQFNPTFIESYGMGMRFLILLVAMFGERLKFYFAWKIAEGASILGGFGFEGYDLKGRAIGWKGVENIDIIGFETAPNVQTATRVWNKRTQGWLERYTYMRTGKSLWATYFISSLWHGLYPGFFFVFLTVPLLTAIERLAKQKLNPIFAPGYDGYRIDTYPKGFGPKVYWYVCMFFTLLAMNYVVQAFTMGSLENTLRTYRSYQFYGHIAIVAAYVILLILPMKKDKMEKKHGSVTGTVEQAVEKIKAEAKSD
jgi:lysophospholipid acyltransferase